MSWAELRRDAPLQLVPSPVESHRFALAVARVMVPDVPGSAEIDVAELAELIGEAPADLVVLRYPGKYVDWFARLLDSGRELLHADTLVYWTLKVGTGRPPGRAPELLVDSGACLDPSVVERFIDEVFRDYDNHYAADPLLDQAQALAGYREWAVGSASRGGSVSVEAGGALVALATTTTTDEHVEIELAGVHPAWQGQGVYPHLLEGCEQRAAKAGAGDLLISTQAHNVAVQRGWARYGFVPAACFTTVHALRRGLR